QQIGIGDLCRRQNPGDVDMGRVDQAQAVGPEHMAGQLPHHADNGCDVRRRSWRVRIVCMADDADDAIFSNGAGRPGRTTRLFEPEMRRIMADVSGVDQSYEHIDVEQKGHGNSSRSALTVSSVTTVASSETG